MKFALALGATLALSLTAFADTTTFNIKGMHCGGCAAMIEKKVCADAGYKTCKAQKTGKDVGTLVIETADGSAVDPEKVKQLVSSAGEGNDKYSVYYPAPAASSKKK